MATEPRKFGKYLIHEEVGRGGFGTVFRATDTALDLEIALKLLDTHLAARDPALVQGFVREGRVAARLTHPSIVRVYDVGDLDGVRFIAMQYLSGGSLAAVIGREAPMTAARVVELLRPIAEALDFAHDQGFVHRDVKPGNIIFDDPRRPVLVDFGLVRAAEGTTYLSLSGRMPGTVQYAAPEQLSALRAQEVGPATDVYALGIVAYQMLTGQVPFDGDTAAVIGSQLNDPPPAPRRLNSAIPEPVEQVVLQALAKDPTQRPARALAFVENLASAGSPAQVAPTPPLPPPERGLSGWALIGIGAAVVALLALGVAAVSRGGPTAAAPTTVLTATPIMTVTLPALVTAIKDTATPTPTETVTPTPTVAAGATRVRELDGAVMVYVPAGEFVMGSASDDSQAHDWEVPQQRVNVAGFWIDRTEVTNGQYRKFMEAGGYGKEEYWTEAG